MMIRRSITCLIALGAFSALLTLSPPAAHAIPVAGDYVFTSGLTGTFTSDGNQLTAWAIQDPNLSTLIWSDTAPTSQVVDYNDSAFFLSSITTSFPLPNELSFLELQWEVPGYPIDAFINASQLDGTVTSYFQGPVTFEVASSASVPEPSVLVLQGLGLGMLAIVGYMRRQRHYAGLQAG